jgi:DNA-directed RNA polymerase specialized sigma24 family protein
MVSIEAVAEAAQFFGLEEGITPERILSGRQELERLYQAIARLTGPCRSVFVMRKFDGKPHFVRAETITRPRVLGLKFGYKCDPKRS